jgi:hypothetical protein
MTTTSGNDGWDPNVYHPPGWDERNFTELFDEMCACSDEVLYRDHGIMPGLPEDARRQAIRDWIREEENFFVPDPARARAEADRIRTLQEDERFIAQLSQRGMQTMPQAIRKLYRQNPSNPKIAALYDSLVRELYDRTDDKLRGALLPAVDRMVDLIDSSDDKVALRAATYVFERLRGKTPDVIEHRQERPFEVLLHKLVTGPRTVAERLDALEGPDSPVDAEIVSTGLIEGSTEVAQVTTGTYDEEEAMMKAWRRAGTQK